MIRPGVHHRRGRPEDGGALRLEEVPDLPDRARGARRPPLRQMRLPVGRHPAPVRAEEKRVDLDLFQRQRAPAASGANDVGEPAQRLEPRSRRRRDRAAPPGAGATARRESRGPAPRRPRPRAPRGRDPARGSPSSLRRSRSRTIRSGRRRGPGREPVRRRGPASPKRASRRRAIPDRDVSLSSRRIPVRPAPGARRPTSSQIFRAAPRTASASEGADATPPTSDLWRRSGETIFRKHPAPQSDARKDSAPAESRPPGAPSQKKERGTSKPAPARSA